MEKLTLEELIRKNEKEETTPQRVYNTIKAAGITKSIRGIREVKEELLKALFKASYLSSRGYIPIVLLMGPSGSGKSDIIESIRKTVNMVEGIGADMIAKPIYTLSIEGKECPYREDPYNMLRTAFPFEYNLKIPASENVRKNGPETCSTCFDRLHKLVVDDTGRVDKESDLFRIVTPTFSKNATIKLNTENLAEKFVRIAKNANRGILIITADKSELDQIPKETYQFLINLYDNDVSDEKGNRIPLDMLVIIHGNEGFLEEAKKKMNESRPLLERIITVKVRRNLSKSEEEKIYKQFNLPLGKTFPGAMGYLSLFNSLSRVGHDVRTTYKQKLDDVIELLDMYDSDKLNLSGVPNISDSLRRFIIGSNLKPEDTVKSLIMSHDGGYISGWSDGVSPRKVIDLLKSKDSEEFSYSDFSRFMKENNANINDVVLYVSSQIIADIRSKIDFSILSFLMKNETEPGFEYYKKRAEEFLAVDLHPDKLRDKEYLDKLNNDIDKLKRYIDIDKLKTISVKYAEKTASLSAPSSIDLVFSIPYLSGHRISFFL